MNKSFTIWRPEPPEGYVSLGDIATANGLDPNNNLDSMVILSSQVKYPVHFNSYPICHLQPDEDTAAKADKADKAAKPVSLQNKIKRYHSGNPRHQRVILQWVLWLIKVLKNHPVIK